MAWFTLRRRSGRADADHAKRMADIANMVTTTQAMSAGTMGRTVTSLAFTTLNCSPTGGVESKANIDITAMMRALGTATKKGSRNSPMSGDFMKDLKVRQWARFSALGCGHRTPDSCAQGRLGVASVSRVQS